MNTEEIEYIEPEESYMNRFERIEYQAEALKNLCEYLENVTVTNNHKYQDYINKYYNEIDKNCGEVSVEAEVLNSLANKAFQTASIYQQVLDKLSDWQF